jgi:hypothetical protein
VKQKSPSVGLFTHEYGRWAGFFTVVTHVSLMVLMLGAAIVTKRNWRITLG